jgi:Domain of unknown function (DUF6487)
MAHTPSQCPKCSGPMEQGFVLDVSEHARTVSHWLPGRPEKSFWMGTRTADGSHVPIGTYRCRSCGFLESYARFEFAAR